MFAHLLKQIWKRKLKNFALSLEILLAFIVVFFLALTAARFHQLAQLPLGFEYQQVWSVQINAELGPNDHAPSLTDNITRTLSALPEVESVSYISPSPYSNSTWSMGYYLPDSNAQLRANMIEASDKTAATLGMKVIEGRWFSEQDEGPETIPVVVNKQLAKEVFPNQSAIGKTFLERKPGSSDALIFGKSEGRNRTLKVVGVIEDFRHGGEYAKLVPYMIKRHSLVASPKLLRTILLKVKPGTERIFEAKLNQQLRAIRSDWGLNIGRLVDMRDDMLANDTIPLKILAVLASFLLVMVAFGLFGVLWQNTTQRIPEIGLRRAVGADSGHIYRQIVIEQLLLSSLAMLVGLVLLIQLPLTGVAGEFANWRVFGIATTVAMASIYAMSILCSLYPAWQASRLSPTEALHYE